MVTGAYKPRNPKASPLYQCVQTHFAEFEASYATRYQEKYGFYRPVIGRVVEKFLGCGDLTKGFARIRCDTAGFRLLFHSDHVCYRRIASAAPEAICWKAIAGPGPP